MCLRVVEKFPGCGCIYHVHAVDACASVGRHAVTDRVIYVGFACRNHTGWPRYRTSLGCLIHFNLCRTLCEPTFTVTICLSRNYIQIKTNHFETRVLWRIVQYVGSIRVSPAQQPPKSVQMDWCSASTQRHDHSRAKSWEIRVFQLVLDLINSPAFLEKFSQYLDAVMALDGLKSNAKDIGQLVCSEYTSDSAER